jgi:triphosphatase
MAPPNFSQQERAGLYTLDETVREAGRKIMASLLVPLFAHEHNLVTMADVVSVHESRKGIRRLRTALNVFAPYYEPGVLAEYRKRFRKVMRCLGRSRDVAVFLIKLDQHLDEDRPSQEPHSDQTAALKLLQSYWLRQQLIVDENVLRFLARSKYRSLLSESERFTRPVSQDEAATESKKGTTRIGHVVPVMIYGRVAAVRSCGDSIESASLKRLHALRIQCKELRHTLEFFEPVIGPSAGEPIAALVRLLTHLGDLNDARVHLHLLDQTPQEEVGEGKLIYQKVKEGELERLIADLPPIWMEVAGPAWRRQLSASLSSL